MKIRQGFVSNSSSSSFIVRAHEPVHRKNGKFLRYRSTITARQEKALNSFGFYRTYACSPDRIIGNPDEQVEEELHVIKSDFQNYNYGYYVDCNQDEVFEFLLKNKIPFVASEHYGHRHVFYDEKTDKVIVAVNFGEIMAMYGVVEKMDVSEPVKTFTRKQYLKKVDW